MVVVTVRATKSLHTTTNCYLVSLALADLITLVSSVPQVCTYSQNVESRMRIAKYEVLLQRPKKILDDFEIFFQNYVLQFIIQKIL